MEKILKQLEEIEQELSDDSGNASLWNERGVGLHLIGRYEEAIDSFKKSLALDRHNPKVHFNLANSYHENEQLEPAIENYLAALDHNPNHTPSLNNLADAYEQAGYPDKAEELFDYLVRLNPGDAVIQFNMGNFLLRQNKHIEAARYYEMAIAIDKEFTDAYFNIAWILSRVEANEKAIQWTKKGLKTAPDHEELLNLLDELEKRNSDH